MLDVFKPEPIPPGHRLWNTPNLIISPHTAADDPNTYNPLSLDIFFDNLRAFRAGRRRCPTSSTWRAAISGSIWPGWNCGASLYQTGWKVTCVRHSAPTVTIPAPRFVIRAKAGIQPNPPKSVLFAWMPAFAGMTGMPAVTGMTDLRA